jgi:hypothetical protein
MLLRQRRLGLPAVARLHCAFLLRLGWLAGVALVGFLLYLALLRRYPFNVAVLACSHHPLRCMSKQTV